MDAIKTRIKGYAQKINTNIDDEDLLDFLIDDVIDRALIYTNRAQLLIVEDHDDPITDPNETTIDLPIPTELERPLAGLVVKLYRTTVAQNEADTTIVKSISDNGQSVTFGDGPATFLNSKSDAEIFSGISQLLDKFVLPKVIENTNNIQKFNRKYILR